MLTVLIRCRQATSYRFRMKLQTIILRNFRAYREETRISVADFVALIGRNDVGKSTILDALGIFFGHPTCKVEADDVPVVSDSRKITIGCEFSEVPTELTIDATASTTLGGEYLLNAAGNLEVYKHFDFRAKKPKESITATANHPTAQGVDDLLSLKNTGLKARFRTSGVDQERAQLNSNPSMRAALYESVADLQLELREISLDEEDGKKIWSKIEDRLPVFALFRADRPSSDEDAEVQDPMKVAVAEAVREVQEQLDRIREVVEAKAVDVANRTLERLRHFDESLAETLTPRFKSEPKWDGFKLSLTGDDEIPINKRGSGVRRLILLSFFQAEVERRKEERGAPGAIYALEEPEASQHPNNQKLVAEALLRMSEAEGCQVLITTHVPALANLVPVESLRHVYRDSAGTNRIGLGSDDGVAEDIARTLGSLPSRDTKVLVYVEGPNDVRFLHNVSRVIAAARPEIIDLAEDPRIVVFPTGGHNLWQWINEDYFSNMNCKEVHIYDSGTSDPPKYQAEADKVNNRDNDDCCFLTSKREAENYLHHDVVAEVFGIDVAPFEDTEDVPLMVARTVNDAASDSRHWDDLDTETIRKKVQRAKRRLNDEVAGRLTYEQLQEKDLEGEIEKWLDEIKRRAEA